jgi:membrane protease YdiL (CAAX protease family)
MTPSWIWQPPPGWPEAPPGWRPPAGWAPPPEWPPAPAGWQFWGPAPPPAPSPFGEPLVTPPLRVEPATRRSLVWETRFVMVAFLAPGVLTAFVLLIESLYGQGDQSRFPVLVSGHSTVNLLIGIVSYLPVGAVVPLALFLLSRTGQPPSSLGLGMPNFLRDILPGAGLALWAYGVEIVMIIPLVLIFGKHSRLINQVKVGHVPASYVLYGIVIAAVTAVTEEVLVNGYLLTRLHQLEWAPWPAFALSLTLRTSYHIYYGLGFLLTVPFGWLVTRSFQKHGRLNRPIAAHFLFDATLITIAVLTS